jgi:hypothetical protein
MRRHVCAGIVRERSKAPRDRAGIGVGGGQRDEQRNEQHAFHFFRDFIILLDP